jgi:hypothetical protein
MDFDNIPITIENLSFHIKQLSECGELLELIQEQVSNPSLKLKKRKARIAILSKEFCSSAECYIEMMQGEIKYLYESVDER